MRTIDLDSLEIFRTVVSEGGVIRAAGKLNRVQSNVTTRIRQLEERLGHKLFLRQGRSLALAPAGRKLLPYADRLLRLAEEAEGELRSEAPVGTFRLGSLESTAGSRLPPVLSRFHKLYPGVVVELVSGTTDALLKRLEAFDVEAAFVSQPFSATGFETMAVFEEELVLITGRSVASVTRPGDLAGATLIAFAQGCSYRRVLEQWLGKGGVLPSRSLEFSSYQAMIACVAAGTGFAIVPLSVLKALRATADVRQHALPERIRANRTHLVWRGTPSVALARLIEMLGKG
ncbi:MULTISPECIES: LysR family transcriptional regulator [unclassified Variovorax]|uniref:LysR family transcriptional regulator n=2 Tax=Variovorax TaxID=34072 RepID=UPI000C9ACA6A|nr:MULTISPECIES: LysR family transcriptional regulator [unclassified Variovorax]PNG52192.1 HTH-type transcriptional regulator GltR [Variovorax sp. B4]PNG54732.1 HTH-type transcriptional regulator GltR [Variovorax sp. B2]VTV15725.1 HTH-type transcriptional regulator GltR [Variovorax sp. WDL1]